MKTSIALLLTTIGLSAATTNVVMIWDVPGAGSPATGWHFYERTSGTRVLLGGSTTNRFTVMNWEVGTSRIFTVASTNMWGEGPECVPYVAPTAPPTPTNLRPVSFNFTVPAPGVLELSKDLIDWRERLRVQSAQNGIANVELVQIPNQPMMFGRVKSPYTTSTLPKP